MLVLKTNGVISSVESVFLKSTSAASRNIKKTGNNSMLRNNLKWEPMYMF